MAEIKSAFELAMEKSKRIVISDEEREKFKQKEILQKAMSLFHRYREGHVSLSEILKEIERMKGETKTLVKESLLSQWIDALSLDDDQERLLMGIESLKGQSLGGVREKFHHILAQCRREREQAKEKIGAQLIETLRKEGIYGSAVDPHVKGGKDFQEGLKAIEDRFRQKIEAIKEALKNS
jgi:hypothetical protein